MKNSKQKFGRYYYNTRRTWFGRHVGHFFSSIIGAGEDFELKFGVYFDIFFYCESAAWL